MMLLLSYIDILHYFFYGFDFVFPFHCRRHGASEHYYAFMPCVILRFAYSFDAFHSADDAML